MLTRIEIDGFKSFRDFELDVPPFLVVIGRNAAGKSNLFDAIQFLSRLAEGSLAQSALRLRGDLGDLFHRHTDGTQMSTMSFAVEVLLNPWVTDAFGEKVAVRHTRLRYELVVERRAIGSGGTTRPYVVRESARRIRGSDDSWLPRFASADRAAALASLDDDSDPGLLVTGPDERGQQIFTIREQGGSGRGLGLPAGVATTTALSTLTTAAEYPLLYALKTELRSWRMLHLDPSALRQPDGYDDPDVLAPNGAHLPNTLRRIADQTGSAGRKAGLLNDLSADVATVVPGIIRVDVVEDGNRRERHIEVAARNEPPFSALVASDGTLRTIALLAALYDPNTPGLICFEEPENGIFPGRLVQFTSHLGALVRRSLLPPDGDVAPVPRQLLLSSHSPAILQALSDHDRTSGAVFLDLATRVTRGQPDSRVTRCRLITPPRNRGHLPADPAARVVSPAEIAEFQVTAALDS